MGLEMDSASDMAAEVAALKEAYAALNRGDVAGFVAVMDEDVRWIEPSDFPGAGVTRGAEALRKHVEFHRGNWAEGRCEAVELRVVPGRPGQLEGRRVVQVVDVRVRLKGEAEWRVGRLVEVYTFRAGKIIEGRIFGDVDEGITWATTAGAGSET